LFRLQFFLCVSLFTEVIGLELPLLLGGKDTATYIEEYHQANARSVPHMVAVAKAYCIVSSSKKMDIVASLMKFTSEVDGLSGVTLKNYVSVHDVLSDLLADKAAAADFKAKCAPLFPWSTFFGKGCGLDEVDGGK